MTYLLIVYLYAAAGANRGAALTYQPMPSLSACQAVGAESVRLASNTGTWFNKPEVVYSCVAVQP